MPAANSSAVMTRKTATAATSVSVVTSPRDVVRVVAETRQAVRQLEAMRQERVDVDPERLGGVELRVDWRARPFDAAERPVVRLAKPGIADRSTASEDREHFGAPLRVQRAGRPLIAHANRPSTDRRQRVT